MHSCWGNYLQKKYVANRREIWCKSERNMVQIGEKYVANRREIRRKSGKSCESGGRCWWQSKFWPQYARDHLPTGGSILSNFLSRQKLPTGLPLNFTISEEFLLCFDRRGWAGGRSEIFLLAIEKVTHICCGRFKSPNLYLLVRQQEVEPDQRCKRECLSE